MKKIIIVMIISMLLVSCKFNGNGNSEIGESDLSSEISQAEISDITISQDSNFTVNNEYSDFVVKQGEIACKIDDTVYYIRSSGYAEPSAIYKKEKGSDKEECVYSSDKCIYSIMPCDSTNLLIEIFERTGPEFAQTSHIKLDLTTGNSYEYPLFAQKECTLTRFFDNHISYCVQNFDRPMMDRNDLYVCYNNSEEILIDSKVIYYVITPEKIIYQKNDEAQLISCNYDGTDKKVIVKYGDGVDKTYGSSYIYSFFCHNNMLYIVSADKTEIFNLKDMSIKSFSERMNIFFPYYNPSSNRLYGGSKEIIEYDMFLNKIRTIITVDDENKDIRSICVIDDTIYYEVYWCEGLKTKFELRSVKI